MRYPKLTRFGLSLAVLIPLARSAERQARADEIDDYTRKLIELDQRVHVMSLEFKETPAAAGRRGRSPRARRAGAVRPEELPGGGDDPAGRHREVPQLARLRRRALPARRVAVPGPRPLFVAALLRAVPAAQHRLGQGAGRAPAPDRDLVPHRRLRARRRVPGQAAEHPARAARAGDAVRARQAVLLPRQGRRGAGRLLALCSPTTRTTSRRATSSRPSW